MRKGQWGYFVSCLAAVFLLAVSAPPGPASAATLEATLEKAVSHDGVWDLDEEYEFMTSSPPLTARLVGKNGKVINDGAEGLAAIWGGSRGRTPWTLTIDPITLVKSPGIGVLFSNTNIPGSAFLSGGIGGIVHNSGEITVGAQYNSSLETDLTDVYGVLITGSSGRGNAVTNTLVLHDGTEVNPFTNLTGPGDDVLWVPAKSGVDGGVIFAGALDSGNTAASLYRVRGIWIQGNGLTGDTAENTVDNSGLVYAGAVRINGKYAHRNVGGITGIGISGLEAPLNRVTNTGAVAAMIAFTDIMGSVGDPIEDDDDDGSISGISIGSIEGAGRTNRVLNEMALVDVPVPGSATTTKREILPNSGQIIAGIFGPNDVEGTAQNIHGVRTLMGRDNDVTNKGSIDAGIFGTSVSEQFSEGAPSVKSIYGVLMEGGQGAQSITNTPTFNGDGDQYAGGRIFAGAADAHLEYGVSGIYGVSIQSLGTGEKVITNEGIIEAGLDGVSIGDEMEPVGMARNIYGAHILATGGGTSRIVNAPLLDAAGNPLDGSGEISAGLWGGSHLEIGHDENAGVANIAGVFIDSGGSNPLAENAVVNSGAISAGLLDRVFVRGYVANVYGIGIKAGEGSENSVTNSGSIYAGVGYADDQHIVVSGPTEKIYGIGITAAVAGQANTVDNSGEIFTEGLQEVYGVNIDGQAAENTVENTGRITATGWQSLYGVNITGHGGSAANTVNNEAGGEIYAGTRINTLHSFGVNIEGNGAHNTVLNRGIIASTGGGEDFIGVNITGHTGAENTVDNYGGIIGEGDRLVYGVLIKGYDAENTVRNYAGGISDPGPGLGIRATGTERVFAVTINGNGPDAHNELQNRGKITASGEEWITGVYLSGFAAPLSNIIDNYDDIVVTASEDHAFGVYIDGVDSTNRVTNHETGTIRASAPNGAATGLTIRAGASSEGEATNTVDNYGGIYASGDEDVYGVDIKGEGAANTVMNSGEIHASGAKKIGGVYIWGDDSTNRVTNSGTIETSGPGSQAVLLTGDGSTNTVHNDAGGWISGDEGVLVQTTSDSTAEIVNKGVIQGKGEWSAAIKLGVGQSEVYLHAGQALYGAEDEDYGTGYRPGIMYADIFPGSGDGYDGDKLFLVGDSPDAAPCVTCGRIYNDAARRIPADTLAAYQIQSFEELHKTGAGAWVITKVDESGYGTEALVHSGYPWVMAPPPLGFDLQIGKALVISGDGMLATDARIWVGGYDGGNGNFEQDFTGSTLGLMVAPDLGYTDDDDAEIGTYPITESRSGHIHVAGGVANIFTGHPEYGDSQLLVIPQMPETGIKYARESSYNFLFAEGGIGGAYTYGPGEVPVSSPFFAATAEKDTITGKEYWLTLERDFALPAAERNELAVGQALNTIYGALDPEGNE
ncbi:MAG: hypothetical protein WCX84_09955, partial [Syntrophales bacterium]